MTRQTYDRAPRLTKLATAHISKGANGIRETSAAWKRYRSEIYTGYL